MIENEPKKPSVKSDTSIKKSGFGFFIHISVIITLKNLI